MKLITTYKRQLTLLIIPIVVILILSCSQKENMPGVPVFKNIGMLKDPNASISVGNMGDWIAIQGENLESVKSIIFNDVAVDMTGVYYENQILYLQVPILMPGTVTDKVKVTTMSGNFDFNFKVNIPNLKLTGMFNEYTIPGDTLKIYGDFFKLYEVDKTNTVVSFGSLENPVIDAGNTYLTVKVPIDVTPNIKLKVINKKYNAEALCPGYYQDRQNVITNFDDIPYWGWDGLGYIGQWSDPKPISGTYSLLKIGTEGSGWLYLMGTDYPYTDDMKNNPEKYEIKFELNMITPIMTTRLYIYNYWNYPPAEITPSDLVVQNLGVWQTIRLPLSRVIPPDFDGNKDYIGSFNVRVESPSGESVSMGWDNFRITLKD